MQRFYGSGPRTDGVIAQLVERLNGIQKVRGSTPLGSTIRVQHQSAACPAQSPVSRPPKLARRHPDFAFERDLQIFGMVEAGAPGNLFK